MNKLISGGVTKAKTSRLIVAVILLVVAGRVFNASGQTETNLYSFGNSPTDGYWPHARLVQGSDGNFYGTTAYGGTIGDGTVFRINPSGNYTTLYSFVGISAYDGSTPYAGLTQGSDGNFYGTTTDGGLYSLGTVFRINSSGSETKLYEFVGFPTDGSHPSAGLVQSSDGNFYGTTTLGGSATSGTVFRISPNGTYTLLYAFDTISPSDGSAPRAALVQGSDSNFYGTTEGGGTSLYCSGGCGTVFRISPGGSETNLHFFGSFLTDGRQPQAGLVQDSDGNFYGTTGGGGTSTNCGFGGCGTVFRISPSGTYTCLYSFAGSPNDGSGPIAGLVQGSDGDFYGTTTGGGTHANGTVFRISPSGSETNLYSFGNSPTDGSNPLAGLVQGSDGNFYGTTAYGGTSTNCDLGCGTVFRISLSGGTNCTYSLGSTNAVFDASAGSGSVSVTTSDSCDWTAFSNDSVITITSGSSGSGNGTVEYSVAANTSTNEFIGTMTIAGRTFTVTQSGAAGSGECTYSLSATNITLVAEGGTDSVSVTTSNSCTWTAVSNSGFIMITAGSSSSGNGTVEYSVAANTSTNEFIGTMTIAGQTFTVMQGTSCGYTLSPARVTFGKKGGSRRFKVTTHGIDCIWSAVGNDGFIRAYTGGGFGNGYVLYTVDPNTNTIALIGTITVAGQTFTVNQAAGGCKFSLSPKIGKIQSTGGSAIVRVNPTLSDCDWTAVSNDSFITITAGTNGVGRGTVSYTVAANVSTNVLTGTMTIAGQTYAVTQAGAK